MKTQKSNRSLCSQMFPVFTVLIEHKNVHNKHIVCIILDAQMLYYGIYESNSTYMRKDEVVELEQFIINVVVFFLFGWFRSTWSHLN